MGVTFLVIGQIDEVPKIGQTKWFRLAAPQAGALYRRRMEAVESVDTEHFCFLDGGTDVLLPGFDAAINELVDRMERSGAVIGYGDELVRGKLIESQPFTLDAFTSKFTMIHHGVVCNTAAVRTLTMPAGCFSWEALVYGSIAQRGFEYRPGAVYDWHPSTGGARLWPSYCRGICNSLNHLHGRAGVHFPSDFA